MKTAARNNKRGLNSDGNADSEMRLWQRIAVLIGLVLLGAALRLVPHPPNLTPITALALFGGAFLGRRSLGPLLGPVVALVVPLSAMVLSDLVLGFGTESFAVYVAFVLVALLRSQNLFDRESRSTARVAATTVMGTLLFFVITNAAVWATGRLYPMTGIGLIQSFVAGLPFLRNSLIGDIFYSGLLFGAWALLERSVVEQQERTN